ncbi:FRIGIDA-like protein 5 isoform X1 [Neltuma alba]|nr:FRIGIDA-like protein 5 isoform X1 [Prosopis alba]
MKLAIEWKENLSVSNKDCLEVLGFLKLVATYELGSSFDATELHTLLDIISQHCQTSELRQSLGIFKMVPDNQLGATRGGRNLHLTVNQQANANGLMGSDILVDPQTLDPAKLVLNMIGNPIVPQSTKEEKSAITAGSHTFLLKWLMRISPDIEPRVREEARKLAHELKAEMREGTENSLEVLGFLLLLSIYGLASSFDEDEILKLLEIVAHHEEAVQLFQTLGFATKASDFVFNLIKKQKPAEAVRFIWAYELADKIPPVDLLREYVQNAKMVSKRRCKKSSFQTKDKARDEELACLQSVLKCISDNNLECQNLVKEIHNRIAELRRLKENTFGTTPGPSSKVEVRQPGQKKRINEGSTKKHQVQPCNNNNNKRPRTAIRPPVAPVSTPIYHQPMFWLHREGVILPGGMPALAGPPTNNSGVGTPMGAGQYGNRGRN